MKNIFIAIALILSVKLVAGNEKAYEKAMANSIQQLYEAKDLQAFDDAAHKFIRIGDAEKVEWLPYYYASLAYVWKSFRIQDTQLKDKNLTESLNQLGKAKTLEDDNTEIIALEGFLYMIQITVDPASRGQTLSPKSLAAFNQALENEPSNPRALLFKGQMQYGMSQFFGSGTDEACALVLKSVELFKKEKDKETIMPSWGLGSALQYVEKCNSEANTEN